jgi:hypothetical protein
MAIRPAYNYHGTSDSIQRDTSRGHVANAGVSPYGVGLPWEGDGLCAANNGTCRARRVSGQELCVGHLRQLKKVLEVADEQDGDSEPSADDH